MALTVNNLERALNKHVHSFTGLLNKQAIRAQDKPFKGTAKRFRLLKNIYLGTEIKPKIEFKETDGAENTGPLPWFKKGTVSDLWHFKLQGFTDNYDFIFRVTHALAGKQNKLTKKPNTFRHYKYL